MDDRKQVVHEAMRIGYYLNRRILFRDGNGASEIIRLVFKKLYSLVLPVI